MKKRKNLMAKIVASLALLAIVLWIVWTGVLFIFDSFTAPSSQELTQEDIERLLENSSWSVQVVDTDATN